MALTINGTGYNSVVAAFPGDSGVPDDGIYYGLSNLAECPYDSGPQYRETMVKFVSLDGFGVKRFSFDRRTIFCAVVIVGSLAGVGAARQSFLTAIRQLARYTVALPDGSSFPGCRFNGVTDCRTLALGGKYVQILGLQFDQVGLAN